MIRNRVILKSVAVFLILETVFSITLPTISWALTAGPTSPEFNNFEPVDASDMVNLSSGDLAYTIPLMEVPGPSGGYPLTLGYHAGILPGEEASWVGLGWSLTPGSVNRIVNGYPDDQTGAVRTRIDHNSGGETNTYTVGVGYGGVSASLSVADDSNQGVQVGGSFGLQVQMGSVSAGGSVGIKPGGGSFAQAGASTGVVSASVYADQNGVEPTVGLAAGDAQYATTTIQTNFQSVGVSSSAGGATTSFMGTKGGGYSASASMGGFSISNQNAKAGTWQQESWGFTVPVYIFSIGYNYRRYWSHEQNDVNVIGTLHARDAANKNRNDWSFDSYALPDPDAITSEPLKNVRPEKQRGGSFPSYDSYSVNAQGLNGAIQPYILENGNLYRQNVKKSDGSCCEIEYKDTDVDFTKRVFFRFKNDFSNSFGYDNHQMQSQTGQDATSFSITRDNKTPNEGVSNDSQLAGSRHIDWFTNYEIQNGHAKSRGFIDTKPHDQRQYLPQVTNQVGGLMVTNESGVTYHYATPVYESQEFSKSFVKEKPNDIYQTNENYAPYAYMWLLTAITGPDYYDKNDNGMVDNGDWGYWVEFDYGMWAHDYKWRNPEVGNHADLDSRINFYSNGQKEVYYLDAIKTQSHVAVFEKERRVDGKGLADNGLNATFTPRPGWRPAEALRLKNIYLLTRDGYTAAGGDYRKSTPAQDEECNAPVPFNHDCDVFEDRDDYQQIKTNAIRVVNFEHTYDLQASTPNSFDLNDPATPATLQGKLTLKSLSFLGKAGFDGIPPMKFEYAHNQPYNQNARDMWGYYKSDYVSTGYENADRRVSEASASLVDAWSLNKIKTSLGATIGISYESDTYRKPVLYKESLLTVANVQPQPQAGRCRISFHNPVDVTQYINAESRLSLKGLIYYHFAFNDINGIFFRTYSCDGKMLGSPPASYRAVEYNDSDLDVITVTSSYVEVESTRLYNDMTLALGTNAIPHVAPYPKRDVNTPCYNTTGQEIDIEITYDRAPEWDGGNLGFYTDHEQPGGGLRVAKVALTNMGSTRTTNYTYEKGTTSYEPFGLDIEQLKNRPSFFANGDQNWTAQEERRKDGVDDFLISLQNNFSTLLFLARELPPPSVIYESVTIQESIKDPEDAQPRLIPGKKVFRYDVFDERMVQRLGIQDVNNSGSVSTQPMTLNDFSTWVGALRSITFYGPYDQILAKTENRYLHDNKTVDDFKTTLKNDYGNQGAITQLFHEYRKSADADYRVFSKRTEYPLVNLGQTATSYKTGITTTSTTLAFDFYTGSPTKTLSTDGYGNAYVSETVPAYAVPDYTGANPSVPPGMGLKVKNPLNRHMLSQVAKNITYKVDPAHPLTTKTELVSYSIQTWSPALPILEVGKYRSETTTGPTMWKKAATYGYVGDPNQVQTNDGFLELTNNTLPPFASWRLSDNPPAAGSGWLKTSQVTLYAAAGQALEACDVNEHYAATQMAYDQSRVFATAADAKYGEFIYAGAEEDAAVYGSYGSGMVFIGTRRGTDKAHTGTASLKLGNGHSGFTMKLNTDVKRPKLHLSAWVHQSNAAGARFYYRFYNGTTPIGSGPTYIPVTTDENKKSGEWYLFEAYIDAPAGAPRLEGGWNNNTAQTVWIDDFRIHPVNSPMISYVYNNLGELTHVLDANNLFTRYDYDEMGRLKEVYKETFKNGTVKTGKSIYHYANQND